MDILDKYGATSQRHKGLLDTIGHDPFHVGIERIISATEAIVGGEKTILAGTNNYLALTFDDECIAAAVQTIKEQGTGTTGSRIANGSYPAHRQLERELAAFFDRDTVLVFSTGYQANLGTIAALAGPKDVIFVDADSHASIYDGCTLSGATVTRFRHNDPADLDRRLSRMRDSGQCALVIVEAVYSVLGDRAPLEAFVEVTKAHNAWLLVDEAHSLGVFGQTGRGLVQELGLEEEVDFVVGTFSKSLAGIGGFAAANDPRFEVLRVSSRPYMFTASATPASIESVRVALRRLSESPNLREKLWHRTRQLHRELTAGNFEICYQDSPIIAVRLPDQETAAAMWRQLLKEGVYVNLALPPGTPQGMCLLRCSVSAAHTAEQITRVSEAFQRARSSIGAAADVVPAH